MPASLFCFILPKATECESRKVLPALQIENSWFSEGSSLRTCQQCVSLNIPTLTRGKQRHHGSTIILNFPNQLLSTSENTICWHRSSKRAITVLNQNTEFLNSFRSCLCLCCTKYNNISCVTRV